MNKNEIDLKNLPEMGAVFKISHSTIESLEEFKNIALIDGENFISLKVTPIGEEHYEVKASLKIKSVSSCVNCGEDVKNWFEDEVTEYLSLNNDEEGEDRGFLLIDSTRWVWSQFIIDSIELEKPYRNYKCLKGCLKTLKDYNSENEPAPEGDEPAKSSAFKEAFSALEGFKGKLK